MENQTNETTTQSENTAQQETKFCSECGGKIAKKAVICPLCGCQVENIQKSEPAPQQIVINNQNNNQNNNGPFHPNASAKNKWVSLLLLFFLGAFGGHKFYEGKIGMGILYLFTAGIFGIGLVVDFFVLLFKPTYYYVY